MNVILIIKSLIAGTCLGCLYGFLFWYERKKAMTRTTVSASPFPIILSIARLGILFFLLYWLLLSQKLSVMLIIVTFFIAFWSIIILKKA